jgi:hypothetical protein
MDDTQTDRLSYFGDVSEEDWRTFSTAYADVLDDLLDRSGVVDHAPGTSRVRDRRGALPAGISAPAGRRMLVPSGCS